jgi:hypothetical protein
VTGLLITSPAGSDKDLGKYQSAKNSNATSDVPTHAMYRPIGITLSRRYTNVTRANALTRVRGFAVENADFEIF